LANPITTIEYTSVAPPRTRARVVHAWEELVSMPIVGDHLHECAVVVKKLPNAPESVLESIEKIIPWFCVWHEHALWRDGVWVCRIDHDNRAYTSQRRGFLAFHTDMSRYHDPPAFTLIRCVRTDPGLQRGGTNLLIHIDDALARLHEMGRNDLLDLLHEPRVLNAASGARPLVPLTPRGDPRGVTRVFDRHAADKAPHLFLTERDGELLDEFIALCATWTDLQVQAPLGEKEMIIFSNHRFLHARTACEANGRTVEVCLGN
jgi:alpha-ketoglutarate-dependent taurine dioxygenase